MVKLAGQLRARQARLALFYKTPERLRNEMMEQALHKGQQQNALELAQLAPVELKALLHPFWAVNGKTIPRRCVFPTIARWSRCVPAFCPDAPSSIWPGRSMPG